MTMKANYMEILQYNGKKIAEASLPALPTVVHEASALMHSDKASMAKVAAIISKDQALCAKVLQVINSPVYGFTGRISTIQNALTLLGYNVVYNIIISMLVSDNMAKDSIGLRQHCYCCSLACGLIAKELNLPTTSECVVAGLLHDFGKMLIQTNFPDAYEQIVQLVRDEDISFWDAEKTVLKFSHEHINAWVAEQWRLPRSLSEPMVYHHAPLSAPSQSQISGVVHLGDFFVRLFEKGSGGDCGVSHLDKAVLRHLNIDAAMLTGMVDDIGALLNAANP